MSECLRDQQLQVLAERLSSKEPLDPAQREHVRGCARCQADLRQHIFSDAELHAAPSAVDERALPPPVEPPARALEEIDRGVALGRYVVLNKLSEGPGSRDFVAYDPELDRRVALKVLRGSASGLEKTPERERFFREAQALARVTHPNVIALFDIGRYGNQAFLVTHFVDGQTLGAWLTAAARSTDEVLRVFDQVAEGLLAAHAAGVVHRAFTVDAVLVSRAGEVVVTQFTVANAVGEVVQEPSPARPPESFAAGVLDERGDQFSFCVALYQVLCPETPLAYATAEQARERLAEVAASRPPSKRHVPPRAWQALKRGLSFEPVQRFSSMQELLTELRAPKRSLRAKRYQRAALAGLVALCVGTWGGVLGQSRATAHCDNAAARFASAWGDTQRQQVRAALTDTVEPYAQDNATRIDAALTSYAQQWADVFTEACRATHVRHERDGLVFDLQNDCLSRRRREFSATVKLLGDGQVDRAKALGAVQALTSPSVCNDTVALQGGPVRPLDDGNPSAIAELNEKVAYVKALFDAGRFAEGAALAQKWLTSVREANVPSLTSEFVYWLGMCHGRINEWAVAEPLLLEAALSAQASRLDRLAVLALSQLGRNTSSSRGEYEEAARYHEQARALLARLPDDGELTSRLLFDWSLSLGLQGRQTEAVEVMGRSLALRTQLFGDTRVETLDALDAMTWQMCELGRFDEAFPVIERALAARRAIFGPDHPLQTAGYQKLGTAYAKAGRLVEAEAMLIKATEHAQRLNQRDMFSAIAYGNLGELLLRKKEFARARVAIEKTMEIKKALWPQGHPSMSITITQLGELEAAEGKYEKALVLFTEALELGRKAYPKDPFRYYGQLIAMGDAYVGLKKPALAVSYFEQALAALPKAPAGYEERAGVAISLADLLWPTQKDRARARAVVEQARDDLLKLPQSPRLPEVDAWLQAHPRPRST